MNKKAGSFTYPEVGVIYWEIEAKRVDLNLPYYFAKKIQEAAEELGAEIYADIWWPYLYVTLVRDVGKEVDECVEKQMGEIADSCKEECGGDQECREECASKLRSEAYQACRDGIYDELRPQLIEKMRELVRTAELYGIVMQTGVFPDDESVKLRLRVEGYNDALPILVGRTIFYRLLDVAYTKHFTDADQFAYAIAEFLNRFYTADAMVKLAEGLSKDKMRISRMYEEGRGGDRPMRKYEVEIKDKDDTITFIITEEKIDGRWVITNVVPGSVLSSVADLTPA
jgi:hypothetical protein